MEDGSSRRTGGRGGIVTVAAAVLLLTGTAIVGVAVASQTTLPTVPEVSGAGPRVASAAAFPSLPERTSRSATAITLGRSRPVVLDIPAIDVHSVLRSVGRTPEGALETPAPGPYYDDAAWYRHSPTPGSLGPAILLGHVDSASNGPSVFFRLSELRPGDRISVGRADESVATFVVDDVRRYPKDDFPTEVVYGDIDHAGLRLLTCGGVFDASTGHYRDNIVVFASLIP